MTKIGAFVKAIALFRRNTKGFSVLDVILAVVVIAILAAAVMTRMNKTNLYDLYLVYTTAHKIASDARLTRRLAVTTGDRHRLRFYEDGDDNKYKIERESGASWVSASEEKTIPADVTMGGSGDDEVIFEAIGSSTASKTFRYTLGSHRYQVTIVNSTGRTKLEAY